MGRRARRAAGNVSRTRPGEYGGSDSARAANGGATPEALDHREADRGDRGPERDEVRARMLALPGIGPWTADYVAMRALAHPDVFLPTDVGVRIALTRLGLDPAAEVARSEAWRPWRSSALMHLWQTLMPAPATATARTEDD